MTIVAIHFTETDILVLSDGLISRGGVNRVLEQDQKIVIFKPSYKIPIVGLGHFSGFSEYNSGDFGIAYAGNFSLVATILKNFLDAVTRLLVIERASTNGMPIICIRKNQTAHFRSGSYDDAYNFQHEELIPITVNLLTNILILMCERACVDFCKNAMIPPDAQFIVFGKDTVGLNEVSRAQILRCTNVSYGKLSSERYSVLPWTIECIGDKSAIPNIISQIESSPEYIAATLLNGALLDEETKDKLTWLQTESIASKCCTNRESVIKNKVFALIKAGTNTIGGDCTVAHAGWTRGINLSTIKNEQL